jgi:hypothetical protein
MDQLTAAEQPPVLRPGKEIGASICGSYMPHYPLGS